MKIIDLFSGAGGFSAGFIQNGDKIVKAVEFDSEIAKTYISNHPSTNIIVDDIKNIDNSKCFRNGEADVIIGGPPCQGFSLAGARNRNDFIDDPRNYLFKHYFNIVKKVNPDVFIMENVKGILTMEKGKIFEEILNLFSEPNDVNKSGYNLYYKVVRAIDFGIPQKRERLILIGTKKKNLDFDMLWDMTKKEIKKENPMFFSEVTVKDAIGNLDKTTENGVIKNPVPISSYQKYLFSNSKKLFNHTNTNHSKVAIKRMKKIKNGENYSVLNEKIKSVHSGAYGRLKWDEPAPTITTRFDTPAGGRFIHPVENRTLSPREAARIQSFPDNFIFYGNKTSICKQIGNAVPPKISYFLAKLTKNILEI